MTELVMRPMMWSGLPDVDAVRPLQENDKGVLDDLNAVLRKHGCADRFGIFLLHRHFPMNDGEILVEYTDADARKQTIVVEKAPAENTGQLLQTAWKFDSDHPAAITVCHQFCHYDNGHKRRHKKIWR